jgi:hypothetical protein
LIQYRRQQYGTDSLPPSLRPTQIASNHPPLLNCQSLRHFLPRDVRPVGREDLLDLRGGETAVGGGEEELGEVGVEGGEVGEGGDETDVWSWEMGGGGESRGENTR